MSRREELVVLDTPQVGEVVLVEDFVEGVDRGAAGVAWAAVVAPQAAAAQELVRVGDGAQHERGAGGGEVRVLAEVQRHLFRRATALEACDQD